MYYRQERALLTGARLTLPDPYALASDGGVLNIQANHQLAMQAVQEKYDELRKNIGSDSFPLVFYCSYLSCSYIPHHLAEGGCSIRWWAEFLFTPIFMQ